MILLNPLELGDWMIPLIPPIPPVDQWRDIFASWELAITAFGGVVIAVLVIYQRIQAKLNDVEQANEQRHADNKENIEKVAAELSPNHGSSVKDAVTRIEINQNDMVRNQGILIDLVHQQGQRIDAIRGDVNNINERVQHIEQQH